MRLRERLAFARARDLTLGTLVERLADVHGDRRLVTEDGPDGLSLTYTEAAALVDRWAVSIRSSISPGDRVVVGVPNGYALFLLCAAVARAGAVAVPVNPKMRDDEIQHVVDDSGAAVVVRDPRDLEDPGGVDRRAPTVGQAGSTDPGDVAALFYTSGTTGRPKGAQLTHRGLVGRVPSLSLLPTSLVRAEAVSGMPVAHIAGFSMLVQLAGFGIPVYLLRKFRPDSALDAIESRRATMFVGVPAMYRMMLEAGAEGRDLSSIRLWASGADAMPYEVARRFQAMGAALTVGPLHRSFGQAGFVDGYGMVELGGGAAVKVSPPGIRLPLRGLMGFPMPGYRLRVVDEQGELVSRGDVGELVVKGPGIMRGYHGQAGATVEALTVDGWLRTGDLARRRPLGLVEFAGRKKDVIKHGGYSVFAAEVEAVLEQHPAVAEAAVIGLPDERKGEIPAAAVLLRDGQTVSEPDLVGWTGERLSDYKVPQRLLFVDELPRTGTDKVQKRDVKALFGV